MPAKSQLDQSSSVARNGTLPLPHEHFARVTEASKFRHDTLTSQPADDGVRMITGLLLDTGLHGIHALLFDRSRFSPDAARHWLSDQQITVQQFDQAAQDAYALTSAFAFDAPLSLSAAAAVGSLPSFTVQAYSGGELKVAGFPYPVVIDLQGLQQYEEQSPIVLDHKVDQPLGHASVTNGQSSLSASGVFSHDNPFRARVLDAHRNGFVWRASIGCEILEAHLVPAGQTFYANGREHQGPLIHATRARLKEITVCASGADPEATITIAASAANLAQGATPMTFSEWLAAKGFDEATLTETAKATLQPIFDAEQAAAKSAEAEGEVDTAGKKPEITASDGTSVIVKPEEEKLAARALADLRATYAGERARIAGITKAKRAVLQPYGANVPQKLEATVSDLELQATADGWPVERFELSALRAARPHPVGMRAGRTNDAALNGRVLEAACCVAGGMPAASLERQYGDQTLQLAHTQYGRRMSLKRLLLEASWANGGTCRFLNDDGELRQVLHDIDWSHRELRADFSTFSLPGILSNLANKFLEEGFYAMEAAWKRIAKVRSVNDFKPHTSFRFWGDMTYEKLGATGEIRHGSVGEIKYVNAVDTYAKLFATTRKDIRNDDVGALTELPRMMGMGAADALNTLFWTTFLAGLDGYGVTMWYTAATTLANGGSIKKNKLTGTSAGATNSGLGLEGLENAKRTFAEQIKPNGVPLGVIPRLLLVPPALEVTAENFRKFPEVRVTTAAAKNSAYPTGNPFVGMFETVMSAYLGTASPLSGTSDTKWWLLADPAQVPLVEVAFLDGLETPTVQSSEADFDVLGIQHRGFFDPGVAMQEPRAAVQCDGA